MLIGKNRCTVYVFLGLFILISLLYLNPILFDFGGTVVGDEGDSLLNSWIITWDIKALLSDPLNIFNAPIFHPTTNILAYSETLFPFALMGLPAYLISQNPIGIYNFVFLLVFIISGFGLYLLSLKLTKNHIASFVAGLIFAFSYAKLFHTAQIQVYPLWYPFVFIFLINYLDKKKIKDLLLFVLFVVLSLYSSVYMGIMLLIFLAFYLLFWLIKNYKQKNSISRFGWVSFGVVGSVVAYLPIIIAYLNMQAETGLVRTVAEKVPWSLNIPTLVNFGERSLLYNAFGLDATKDISTVSIFLGFSVIILSIFGIAKKGILKKYWPLLAAAAVMLLFGFGPMLTETVPSILYPVFKMPFFSIIRNPARFIEPVLFTLAIFAGFGVKHLIEKRKYTLSAVLLVVLMFELFAVNPPSYKYEISSSTHEAYAYLKQQQDVSAIVELPFSPEHKFWEESFYLVSSFEHGKKMFNGYSGTFPNNYFENRWFIDRRFPEMDSIERMRSLGINYVVVHLDKVDSPSYYLELDTEKRFDYLEKKKIGDVIIFKFQYEKKHQ